MSRTTNTKGFTLLELLIVIAVIAILATIIVVVINPVEVLRRSRDVQRLSDLSSLNTALALYLASDPTPEFDGAANTKCKQATSWTSNSRVFYSYADDITDTDLMQLGVEAEQASDDPASVDGTGWVPIDLGFLSGSSPIAHLPIDPMNTVVDAAHVSNSDLVYRYACRTNQLAYEINARLESIRYTSEDNKLTSDGGDNDDLYEIGSRLDILTGNSHF